MKRISLVLFAVLFLIGADTRVAVAEPTVAGDWTGAIDAGGVELGILVTLALDGAGNWTGTIGIPQQGLSDVALESIEVDGDAVRFALPKSLVDASFDGRLYAADDRIEGTFTQSGRVTTFHLERDTEDPLLGRLDGFEDFVGAQLEPWNVPGLAITIVHGDEVLLSRGFGVRNVETKEPVTASTLFAIGSSTKAFTTATLSTLVDAGELEWDTPVVDVLPDFRMHDPTATLQMTPRDLVTHRSGLPRHDLMWYNSPLSREDIYARLRHLEPSHGLRETFQYQNLMYMTAGLLAGRVAGTTWEDLVRSALFEPLGMTSSNFSVLDSQHSNDFASPHDERDGEITMIPFRDITTMGPAGSINSNLVDMTRWLMLHVNEGEVDGQRIVSAAEIANQHAPHMAITRPFRDAETPIMAYGLGWVVEPWRGHHRVHHGGNIDGFTALVTVLPADDLGIVVLSNRNETELPELVTRHAMDRLLDLEPRDWVGEAHAEWIEARARDEEAAETEDPSRHEDTKPSHEWKEYAGVFEHPGYGAITVEKTGRRDLVLEYHGMRATLEHFHYDIFTLHSDEEPVFEGTKLSYRTSENGRLEQIEIAFEPRVSAIVFERRPPSIFDDPEAVAAVRGDYWLSDEVFVRIDVRGDDTLTAYIEGQPVYTLEQTDERTFGLKGLTGYSIVLGEAEKGRVESIRLVQPNGVFEAERKD